MFFLRLAIFIFETSILKLWYHGPFLIACFDVNLQIGQKRPKFVYLLVLLVKKVQTYWYWNINCVLSYDIINNKLDQKGPEFVHYVPAVIGILENSLVRWSGESVIKTFLQFQEVEKNMSDVNSTLIVPVLA